LVADDGTSTPVVGGTPEYDAFFQFLQNGGVPLPLGSTLDEKKAAKISELSDACSAAIVAGFTSSALGSTYTYPSKNTDQQNLASSVLSSLIPGLPGGWTTPFWCADSNGTWGFIPHTASQIQQVGMDGKNAILACMARNAALASQVYSAVDADAVKAITWAS
jgi:hypothetical protein